MSLTFITPGAAFDPQKNDHIADGSVLTDVGAVPMSVQSTSFVAIGTALNEYVLAWDDDSSGPITLAMRPGSVLVTPAGLRHRAEWEPHARFAVAFLDLKEALGRCYPSLLLDEACVENVVGAFDMEMHRLVASVASHDCTPAVRDLAMRDIGDRLVARYATVTEQSASFGMSDRAMLATWIDNNLDGACTIAALARLANLSSSHFARLFKKSFGVSVHRFVRGRRIERARTLLAKTSDTVAEVAANCGFASPAHLAAELATYVGRTPVRYRRDSIDPNIRL